MLSESFIGIDTETCASIEDKTFSDNISFYINECTAQLDPSSEIKKHRFIGCTRQRLRYLDDDVVSYIFSSTGGGIKFTTIIKIRKDFIKNLYIETDCPDVIDNNRYRLMIGTSNLSSKMACSFAFASTPNSNFVNMPQQFDEKTILPGIIDPNVINIGGCLDSETESGGIMITNYMPLIKDFAMYIAEHVPEGKDQAAVWLLSF